MNIKKLSQYNTAFQKMVIEKYAGDIPDNDDDNQDYEKIQDFLFIMEAAEQYEVENEMIEFLNTHINANVKDLNIYFHSIVPDGLPPCASDWKDDDDE